MSTAADTPAPPRSKVQLVARWFGAFALAALGAGVLHRVFTQRRAHAAARLLTADLARFEGCLYGAPLPPQPQRAARLEALAQGEGDPYWPHSCSGALGRIVEESSAYRLDDGSLAPVELAARNADSALGEAVFWTERRGTGSTEPPAWSERTDALHRAIESYGAARGYGVPPSEVPHRARRPRPPQAALPAPRPAPLPGGAEASVLDGRVDAQGAAWLMRDRRGHYARCVALHAEASPVRCNALTIDRTVDPRNAQLLEGVGPLRLSLWLPSPSDARLVLDGLTGSVLGRLEGTHDPRRELWSLPHSLLAVTVNSLHEVAFGDGVGPAISLPDVTPADRVLVGHGERASLVWLDTRRRGEATLRARTFSAGPHAASDAVLAVFHAPAFATTDRGVEGCATTGEGAWVVARDRDARHAWQRGGPGVWSRMASFSAGPDALSLACDAERLLVRHGATALLCTRAGCAPSVSALGEHSAVALGAGAVLHAHSDDAGLVQLERVGDAAQGQARFEPESARGTRLYLWSAGEHSALLAVGAQTQAWFSHDGGRTFSPRRVLEPDGSG